MNIPHITQGYISDPLEELSEESDVSYVRGDLASKEVIDEACELYNFHLSRRIDIMGMRVPLLDSLSNKEATRNTMALKKLSIRFIMSPQHLTLYDQAQDVDLIALNFNILQQLLSAIFQGSDGEEPWKRVLAVFYFCSDLSLRILKEQVVERFIKVHSWTNFYLGVKLATWVEKKGGWSVVLLVAPRPINYARRLSILGFCCISVLAIYIYIRRR